MADLDRKPGEALLNAIVRNVKPVVVLEGSEVDEYEQMLLTAKVPVDPHRRPARVVLRKTSIKAKDDELRRPFGVALGHCFYHEYDGEPVVQELLNVLAKHGASIRSTCQSGCELEVEVGGKAVGSFTCSIPKR